MAATFGMGLSGCNDDNNSSNNGPGLGGQNSPKGTLIGTVVDTNGNPVPGAVVTIGTRTQTTNAAGAYQFDALAVTDAVVNSGNGDSASNRSIPLFVQAPAGFLSGTVAVALNSQFSCSEGSGPVTGGTNPQCVLIDGFNVGAGATVLPALNTNVVGTLRNQTTGEPLGNQVLTLDFDGVNIDQADFPGVTVNAFQASGAILTTTTAADGSFTFANVAADSCYELRARNLDLNSTNNGTECTGGNAPGQGQNDAATILFATVTEATQTTNLAEILATTVSNQDLTLPFVTRVVGVIDGTANPGQLANGVNTTFTIDFSEALALPVGGTSQSDVILTTGGGVNPQFISSTVTVVDSNTISVVVPAAIPVGTKFSIDLRQDVFVDTSSNPLRENPQDTAPDQGGNGTGTGAADVIPPVAYDTDAAAAGYIRLNLQIFKPIDTDTGAAVTGQDVTAENPASDQFFAATQALADFIPGTGDRLFANKNSGNTEQNLSRNVAGIEQLNAVFPLNTGISQPHPLVSLVDILQDRVTNTPPNGPTVDVAAAAADIVFGTADHYLAWVEDRNGSTLSTIEMSVGPANETATGNPRIVGTLEGFQAGAAVPKSFSSATTQFPKCDNTLAGFTTLGDDCPIFVISKGNATSAKIYIRDSVTPGPFKNLQPGSVLKIISRTATGFTGSELTIPLLDVVAPTAGAQFFAGTAGALSSQNAQNSGSGGTTINLTSSTGQVIYPVTPQALDVIEEGAANATTGLANDTLAEITTASRPALVPDLVAAPGLNFVADATGTAAFLGAPTRGLGLVVTEPTTIVTGAAPVTANGVVAAIAGITSINNGQSELTEAVNLLGFSTNVLTLEADGRAGNRTIDFSPTFTDTATTPNQANRAIVNVRDFLPPIVTKAIFDGSQFVIRTHEPVAGGPGAEFSLACSTGTVTLDMNSATANATALVDQGGTRIRFPLAINVNNVTQDNPAVAIGAGVVIGSDCFKGGTLAYAEPGQTDLATLTTAGDTALSQVSVAPSHGALTYPTLRDTANNTALGVTTNGGANTWNFWGTQGLGMGGSPTFAMANVVPPFVVTSQQCTNFIVPTAVAPAPGNIGSTFQCTLTFSGPVFVSDLIAAGPGQFNDANGQDADEVAVPGGIPNNGIVEQGELTAYFASKFEVVTNLDVQKATLSSATLARVVNGVSSTTFGNDGTTLTLVYTIDAGGPLASGDQFRLNNVPGTAPAPLVAGETASKALTGAIDRSQFVLLRDNVDPITAREVPAIILP